MGYSAGKTLHKSLQRTPQSSRAVTQPRPDEDMIVAPTWARTAHNLFRDKPDRHLTSVHKLSGIQRQANEEEIKAN
jgi:hypothetical protein